MKKLNQWKLFKKYTNNFRDVLNKFNLTPPNIEPTATGHILEQIEMIEMIIENGFAYEKNGSVYFDLMKFSEKFKYGKLSNRNLDDIINESRELLDLMKKRILKALHSEECHFITHYEMEITMGLWFPWMAY